jgi:hypothetical protein
MDPKQTYRKYRPISASGDQWNIHSRGVISAGGTYEKWREVSLESAKRSIADIFATLLLSLPDMPIERQERSEMIAVAEARGRLDKAGQTILKVASQSRRRG